jgi:hypothetical protein
LFLLQPTKHDLTGQQRDWLDTDVSERCCNIAPRRHRLNGGGGRRWEKIPFLGCNSSPAGNRRVRDCLVARKPRPRLATKPIFTPLETKSPAAANSRSSPHGIEG